MQNLKNDHVQLWPITSVHWLAHLVNGDPFWKWRQGPIWLQFQALAEWTSQSVLGSCPGLVMRAQIEHGSLAPCCLGNSHGTKSQVIWATKSAAAQENILQPRLTSTLIKEWNGWSKIELTQKLHSSKQAIVGVLFGTCFRHDGHKTQQQSHPLLSSLYLGLF